MDCGGRAKRRHRFSFVPRRWEFQRPTPVRKRRRRFALPAQSIIESPGDVLWEWHRVRTFIQRALQVEWILKLAPSAEKPLKAGPGRTDARGEPLLRALRQDGLGGVEI